MNEQPLSVKQQAALDFEQQNPQPVPPAPVLPGRPAVIPVGTKGESHLWIDVQSESHYNRPARLYAALYVIERKDGKDQRIQGELTADALTALLTDLTRVRDEIVAREAFAEAVTAHEQAVSEWKDAKDEFIRERQLEWERTRASVEQIKE